MPHHNHCLFYNDDVGAPTASQQPLDLLNHGMCSKTARSMDVSFLTSPAVTRTSWRQPSHTAFLAGPQNEVQDRGHESLQQIPMRAASKSMSTSFLQDCVNGGGGPRKKYARDGCASIDAKVEGVAVPGKCERWVEKSKGGDEIFPCEHVKPAEKCSRQKADAATPGSGEACDVTKFAECYGRFPGKGESAKCNDLSGRKANACREGGGTCCNCGTGSMLSGEGFSCRMEKVHCPEEKQFYEKLTDKVGVMCDVPDDDQHSCLAQDDGGLCLRKHGDVAASQEPLKCLKPMTEQSEIMLCSIM